MDLSAAIVGTLLKSIAGDPLMASLRQLQAKVDRILEGALRDGRTALEDASHAESTDERERLLLAAIEYFRQAYSRAQAPWTSLAAEYMALCYDTLGRTADCRRWLERALETCRQDQRRQVQAFYYHGQSGARIVARGLREDLKPSGLGRWLKGIAGIDRSDRSVEAQDERSVAFNSLFALDKQSRRVEGALRARGPLVTPIPHLFPDDSVSTCMKWDKKSGGYAFAFRSADGSSDYWTPGADRVLPHLEN